MNIIYRGVLLVSIFVALFILSSNANAIKPIYSGGKDRAAIRGYDPVSYFTENQAVEGSKDFSYEYNGALWLFSTEVNRIAFQADPEKYAPQYGGYCAYAVARGSSASSKPEYFTIHDGKLYLNFSSSVYKKWTEEKEEYIEKADENWPTVLAK